MTEQAPTSRSGTKQISGHFDPEVSRALKLLAVELDKPIQALLAQALNDLFEKNGLPRLADEIPALRGGAAAAAKKRSPG